VQVNILKVIILVTVVALWQFLSFSSLFTDKFFPSPWAAIVSIKTLSLTGLPQGYTLIRHIEESLYRVLNGFFLALLVAVPMGIMMGWSRVLRELVTPLVEIIRPIPPLAWIPLAIFWFGIGLKSSVFIIFLGAFFPMLLSTVSGVLSVDALLIEAARTLGARRRDIYLKILIPGATPAIYTGARIGMGIAWMTLIAAEFTGVKSGYGLGYMIMVARDIQRPDHIVAGMIIIGVIGYTLDVCLRGVEHAMLRWR
jgi:ABC-type nitrate/sulfonate/bicarbonate transport system permease component